MLKSKTQTAQPETPQIPLKPVMSAEAAEYPRLLKIYKELNRQNGIIFNAERERNELELERDSLKGLAKLTKKGNCKAGLTAKRGNRPSESRFVGDSQTIWIPSGA